MKKIPYFFIVLLFFQAHSAIGGGLVDFLIPSNSSTSTNPLILDTTSQRTTQVPSGQTVTNNSSRTISTVNESIPIHCASPLLIDDAEIISFSQLTCKPLVETTIRPFTSVPLEETLKVYTIRVLAFPTPNSYGTDALGKEYRLDISGPNHSLLYTVHQDYNQGANVSTKTYPYVLSSATPIMLLNQGENLQARLWNIQRKINSGLDHPGARYQETDVSDHLYSIDLWGELTITR